MDDAGKNVDVVLESGIIVDTISNFCVHLPTKCKMMSADSGRLLRAIHVVNLDFICPVGKDEEMQFDDTGSGCGWHREFAFVTVVHFGILQNLSEVAILHTNDTQSFGLMFCWDADAKEGFRAARMRRTDKALQMNARWVVIEYLTDGPRCCCCCCCFCHCHENLFLSKILSDDFVKNRLILLLYHTMSILSIENAEKWAKSVV